MGHPNVWMLDHLSKLFASLEKEELMRRVNEFMKFIYIASVADLDLMTISKELDEIWHAFILQTREYEKLCLSLPGKRFIHHQSGMLSDYLQSQNRLKVVRKMLEWIPHYYKYFGAFTEETAKYWFVVRFLMSELQLSLAQVNAFAKLESERF